jgi:uncharacterized protein (TIGR00369 family)
MDRADADRVRSRFAAQPFMQLLGASVRHVSEGTVTLAAPSRRELRQQHGFVHAGAVAALLDTACGFAALSVADAGAGVLTAEYKINLLRPVVGDIVVAQATVARAGRFLTVCQGRAWTETADADRAAGPDIALMTATLATVRDRPDVTD